MEEYIWETSAEINKALAERLKKIRKRKGYTQKSLSEKCNVSYGTLKHFEQSGNISLSSLTKIAMALGVAEEIKLLFSATPYRSLEEIRNERDKRA